MYCRKENIRKREVTCAMGGTGTVTFTDWLLPDDAPKHGRVFSKVTLPCGSSIGYHSHSGEFEAFYVLQGVAVVNDNGEEVILGPGDMHLCRNGDAHSLKNGSDSRELTIIALIMNALDD